MKFHSIAINPALNHIRPYDWAAICGAAALSILMLSSCKNDDVAERPELKSQTYTSSTLALTYNGEAMPGKSVDIDVASADQGMMTLYSKFDLSQLSGLGLSGAIEGPGVIPGSPTLTLPINFEPGDGCYTFAGQYSTSDVDFKYSGKLEKSGLTLTLTDCTLTNQLYAGKTFAPAPIKSEGAGNFTSLPFHLVWELDPSVKLPDDTSIDVDLTLSELLKLLATAPIIPVYNNTAYMSIAQAYVSVVKTVCLTPSGNIPVMYISTVGGAARLATTNGNMLQYICSGDGILLYVNPLSAVGEVLMALSKPQEDAEFVTKSDNPSSGDSAAGADSSMSLDPAVKEALLKSLLATIGPSLSQGIPLTVAPAQQGADIYFNTATSVTFLSNLLENMMQNPVLMETFKAYLASLDLPQLPAEDIEAILVKLPGYLEKTTKLEIGLSFVNYPVN